MNQRHLLVSSESDSIGASIQTEIDERGGSQFPYQVGRENDEGTQLSCKGSSDTRNSLGATHFTETLHKGIHFLSPQVFLLIILLYT